MAVEDLQKSDMMQHLLDALDRQQDIGHYGRLVFTMIARHFLSEAEVKQHLLQDPGCDEAEATSLYNQVQGKDYSPPKRDRILEWQIHQDFPICPNADDPDACNVYRDLQFPDHVYEHISSYYEHKT
jgi:hypothetical protein